MRGRYGTSNDDCDKFVKVVAAIFFDPDLFSGPNMNADAIIAEMNSDAAWTKLGTSHTRAITAAQNGNFLVAGMTSTELSDVHGHLAIVVGDAGALSGMVLVPICYAGSLNASARVARKRVSETFGARVAQANKISYFSRVPNTVPVASALDRLLEHLHGEPPLPAVFLGGRPRTFRDPRNSA